MKKYGTFLHILMTAAVGIVFFIIGEALFPLFTNFMWQPLGIALYFLIFALAIYGSSALFNRLRGDYSAWEKQNLVSTVTSNYKKAAIVLAVVFVASLLFEFSYEVDGKIKFNFSNPKTSYIFCIDNSSSMDTYDPEKKSIKAIGDIMSKEKKNTEFAVYKYDTEVERIRDMAPYVEGEVIDFDRDGLTYIVNALKTILDDIESGTIKVGDSVRILLLTDGIDMDSYAGLDEVLARCNANGIIVSTVGFGDYNEDMERIASETGGTYSTVSFNDVDNLGEEMKNVLVKTDKNRNLLSERSNPLSALHIILRIVFLILIGAAFSWMKQKCYSSAYDHAYEDKVFFTSMILCSLSAILVEGLFLIAPDVYLYAFNVTPSAIRLIFCIMWSIYPGFFVEKQPERAPY